MFAPATSTPSTPVAKVFRPDLRGKPVVVLRNNDGCVIARSAETKRLGIKRWEPRSSSKRRNFLKNCTFFQRQLRALREPE